MNSTSLNLNSIDEKIIRERVEYFYRLSNLNENEKASQWYSLEYHATAKEMLKINPRYNLMHWCGVISALSPNTPWQKNKQFALLCAKLTLNTLPDGDTLFDSGIRCLFKLNLQKVLCILELDQNEMLETNILGVLNAPKTSHFFLNGLYPEQETGATLDSHMGQMFCPDVKGSVSFTDAAYRKAEEIFVRVAREKSMLSHQLQALLWCTKIANG
jgi:hypothetical protein